MKCYNTILISILLLTNFSITQAQTNYPYSRYGIGDAVNTANVFHMGMAGVSLADAGPYILNYNNPASFSKIGLSTFQFASRGNRSRISDGKTIDIPTGSLDIGYVNLGLPINKNTGLSFGLMPISKMYFLLKNEFLAFDTTRVFNANGGNGNFQNIYIGAGHSFKNLSVGVNLFYTFGNKNIKTVNNFADSLAILTSQYERLLTGGGFGASLGAQYLVELKKGRNIRLAATYNPAYSLKTNTDLRYSTIWRGSELDTAFTQVENKGKIKMPSSFGAGAMLKLNDKINVGLDYNTTQWSNYKFDGAADSLTNNYKIALGLNYIPDVNAANNYWKHVEYRFGLYTGTEFVKLRNTIMPVKAATAGISFPLRRTRDALGFLHTAFEIGSRGTFKNNLFKDNFTRFNVGLTLNAKWFNKRKYD